MRVAALLLVAALALAARRRARVPHELSRHAFSLWAPTVDAFLARLGPPWNVATTPRPVLRLDAGGLSP